MVRCKFIIWEKEKKKHKWHNKKCTMLLTRNHSFSRGRKVKKETESCQRKGGSKSTRNSGGKSLKGGKRAKLFALCLGHIGEREKQPQGCFNANLSQWGWAKGAGWQARWVQENEGPGTVEYFGRKKTRPLKGEEIRTAGRGLVGILWNSGQLKR